MDGSGEASPDTVVVRESAEHPGRETFVIQQELLSVDDARYDEIYKVLSYAAPDQSLSTPIYRMSWRHVVAPENAGLQEYVALYIRLERFITERGPDRVVCGDEVSRGHAAVVRDVAECHGLEATGGTRTDPSRAELLGRVLKNTVLILPFLFDQIFSIVWKYIGGVSKDIDLAFVPSLGRIGSTGPVLDGLLGTESIEHSVVITSKVSSQVTRWRWKYLRTRLAGHDLDALGNYTDVQTLFSQLATYIEVSRRALLGDAIVENLDELLTAEFGVELDRTLRYVIYDAFRTRVLLSTWFYELTGAMMEETECQKIVIGGLSPSRRAIMLSSMEHGAAVYYVPHNIGSGGCPNPPSTLTHFVSGQLEARKFAESDQVRDPWHVVVTGRPYLVELHREYEGAHGTSERIDTRRTSSGPLQLLVATQGFDCRQDFVEDVLASLDDSDLDAEVVIKTHPAEDPDTYSDYEETGAVTVTDADLAEHIAASDLTVTINSNVGLESVIAGTPTICLNRWKPSVSDPVYAEYGPIPLLRRREELVDRFRDIGADGAEELWREEAAFVEEAFELDTDAARNMLDVILS